MDKKPGLFKYFSFGLRKDWVELFFTMKTEALCNSSLGPKQKDALYFYLKDMELIDSRQNTSQLFEHVLRIYHAEGINSLFLWSVLWNNLSYNSPIFEWWNEQSMKRYGREEMITSLVNFCGKMNHSIQIAYQSLVGTLEKTPFGSDLRQGVVQKVGAQRVVNKLGHPDLSPFALLYALVKRAERRGETEFDLTAIAADALSPQTIFALETAEVERGLRALWLPELFEWRRDDDQAARVALMPGITTQDVLAEYIERLHA